MKSNKKKQSRCSSVPVRLILILLILIVVVVIIMLFQTGFEIKISNPFVKTEKTVSSEAVLKQVVDISRLSTIEYIYKTVFPYDLINPDADLAALVKKFKAGERLNFNEIEMLSIYGISSEAGIDLLKETFDFAVVTVRIKAGYDFPEKSENILTIDPESKIVSIKLPPVKITEVIIEDADSSVYNYPDLNINPEQWKTLTSILSRVVKDKAEKKGILQAADIRGQNFIEQLLLNAGYPEIVFIN